MEKDNKILDNPEEIVEEVFQDSVDRIWALLDQVKEVEDDNVSMTKIFWRQTQDKHWDLLK